MNSLLIWYAIGVVGVCIISHFDCKEREKTTIALSAPASFLKCIILSLLGPLALAFSIYIIYCEVAE